MSDHWLLSTCLSGILIVAVPSAYADFGDPFPDAGQDVFDSTFSHGAIEILANPFSLPVGYLPDVDFEGPTVVDRDDPALGLGGLFQISTEIVSMDLTGSIGPIDATIHESPTRVSGGLVREITPGGGQGTFNADSFFDMFFEIEIDGGPTLYNRDAGYMEALNITELPPYGDSYTLRGWIEEGSSLMGDFVDLTGGVPDGFHPLPSALDPMNLYALDEFGTEHLVAQLHGTDLTGHAVVPVPGTAALCVLGLALIGVNRRRFS